MTSRDEFKFEEALLSLPPIQVLQSTVIHVVAEYTAIVNDNRYLYGTELTCIEQQ